MEKKWNSLEDYFHTINEKCEYLIIRNYENLFSGEEDNEHDDIDFLCRDIDDFLFCSAAIQREPSDKIHCYINLCGKLKRIDIRSVGDGYYDEKWETDMLDKRIMMNDSFYVMDKQNYYYSLIYHEVYHKKELKPEYEERLKKMALEQDLVFSKENMNKIIDDFLQSKGYMETGYRSR